MNTMKEVLSNAIGLLAGIIAMIGLIAVFNSFTDNRIVAGGVSGALSFFFGVLVNILFDKMFKISETSDV